MNPFVLVLSENYQGCSKYLKVLSCPGSSSSCVCAQRRVVRYRTEAIVTQGSVAVKAVRLTFTCLCVFLHDTRFQLILTWQGRHHDHEVPPESSRESLNSFSVSTVSVGLALRFLLWFSSGSCAVYGTPVEVFFPFGVGCIVQSRGASFTGNSLVDS